MAATVTIATHKQGQIEPKVLREFGLIFGLGIALIFGLIRPVLTAGALPLWPWIFCGVLAGMGWILPRALAPVYATWMAFGSVMGAINSRILLGLIFYTVILPIGLLIRRLGQNPMALRFEPDQPSYRIPSRKLPVDRMEKPY